MARNSSTVRRVNREPVFVPAPGHRIGNKNIMNRRNNQFKIKKILPEAKPIQLKKNGQVLRTMNVHRKAIHFSVKRRLRF